MWLVRPSNSVGSTPSTCRLRVGQPLHVVHRVEQLADAAVRQRLALQRDDDLVGGGQRVDREDAQRRRAVEQDHVVVVADLVDARAEARTRGRSW